jgi:hypothetical protein
LQWVQKGDRILTVRRRRRRRRRRELVVVVVVGLDVAETSWLLEMWVEIGKKGTSMGWGWSKKLS